MVKVDENDRWAEKKQKKRDRQGTVDNAGQELNEFMQDIEEDPDMRANINLYKDTDVINELEAQFANMGLSDKKDDYKSPIQKAQEEGSAIVGGDQRKVVSTKRKTKQGEQEKIDAEKRRQKNNALFKATLRKQTEDDEGNPIGSDDDEWEDLEEDFPAVKLEELMENLKIDSDNDEDEESKQ